MAPRRGLDHAAIVARLRDGEPPIDIARDLGVTRTSISYIARKHGLGRRALGTKANPHLQRLHPLLYSLLSDAGASGMTLDQLGARAGVRRQTISNWIAGRDPGLSRLERVADHLGYDLRLVKRGRR